MVRLERKLPGFARPDRRGRLSLRGSLRSCSERLQKRLSSLGQLFSQPFCTFAVAASPRLRAALITTLPPVMGVLNFGEFEVLFPVGLFFLQRRRAVANLHPASRSIGAQPSVLHVPEIFAFGNRALPQGSAFNCIKQLLFPTCPQPGSYQITHLPILRGFSGVLGNPHSGISRNRSNSGRSRTADSSACSGAPSARQSNLDTRATHRLPAAEEWAGAKARSMARRNS